MQPRTLAGWRRNNSLSPPVPVQTKPRKLCIYVSTSAAADKPTRSRTMDRMPVCESASAAVTGAVPSPSRGGPASALKKERRRVCQGPFGALLIATNRDGRKAGRQRVRHPRRLRSVRALGGVYSARLILRAPRSGGSVAPSDTALRAFQQVRRKSDAPSRAPLLLTLISRARKRHDAGGGENAPPISSGPDVPARVLIMEARSNMTAAAAS